MPPPQNDNADSPFTRLQIDVGKLETTVTERTNYMSRQLDVVVDKLDGLVTRAEYEAIVKDVEKLQSNQSRIAWIVLTAFLMALVNFVFTQAPAVLHALPGHGP